MIDQVREFLASLTLTSALAYVLLAVNVVGLGLMFIDKQCARHHLWRIPERTLWLVAYCFGATGCSAGMWIFRHKTRKQPFFWLLPLLAVLQIAAVVWLYTL